MQKNLTTTKNTNLILKKSKSMLNITNRILSGSKNLTTKRDDVVIHADIMLINGLMWQKETVEEKMKWEEAMEYAENLRLGGYDDWRLSTIDEFREVIISCCGINTDYGDDNWDIIIAENKNNKFYEECYKLKGFTSNYYWSSSTDVSSIGSAWGLRFYNAYTYNGSKHYSGYVRCVRAGQ